MKKLIRLMQEPLPKEAIPVLFPERTEVVERPDIAKRPVDFVPLRDLISGKNSVCVELPSIEGDWKRIARFLCEMSRCGFDVQILVQKRLRGVFYGYLEVSLDKSGELQLRSIDLKAEQPERVYGGA